MKTFLFVCLWITSLTCYPQDTTNLSLLFLGDIMQHDSQIADAYEPSIKGYNYKPCFQYVKPYTESVDLAIGNLELTLAGPPYKGYPQFGAPDELLVALKDMGLDVLVTANNHCVDRGKRGLERTIEMLDSFQILHTGTFRNEAERLKISPLLVEKNGFKLAILNYTYGTNGLPVYSPNIVNMLDRDIVKRDMASAKQLLPDAIIVFVHWGAEYQSLPAQWQKDFAKLFFDEGAHIVIGAHPHVLQPMEWNKNESKLIAYSLGNFVSGQRKRYTDGGAMIRIELRKISKENTPPLVSIDSAGYILEWVYRTADAEKNYYVLPVPITESNVKTYVKDQSSREAFKQFVDDSRLLFKKYNFNVDEWKTNLKDSLSIQDYIDTNSNIRNLIDTPPSKQTVNPAQPPIPLQIKISPPDSVNQKQ